MNDTITNLLNSDSAIGDVFTAMKQSNKRTDIHRPSAINPTEYEYVAYDYIPLGRGGDILGDCAFLQAQRERTRMHMAKTGGSYSRHEHGGSCHICGAGAIYTITFYHAASNTYIKTGQDCAQKLEMSYSNFDLFKKNVKEARKNVAGKRKAEKILSDAGLSAAWALYVAEWNETMKYEENTIRDIVGKLVKYGSISENAENFVRNLLAKIDGRAAVQAKRDAEKASAEPIPGDGRMMVVGVVLTTRREDTMYGTVTKVMVKADQGWTVWGTLATSICDAKRGDRVSFSANVTVSNNDPKHGFFNRPTKAEILVVAE